MACQILRFVLPSSTTISSPTFKSLRRDVAVAGAHAQHYGYSMQTRAGTIPKERHQITWVIQWPDQSSLSRVPHLRDQLVELAGDTASSLLVNAGGKIDGALDAPICEMGMLRLKADAPFEDPAFQTSMHKTYTDCYRMHGFVGGDWGYCSNTNSVPGLPVAAAEGDDSSVDEQERRLAVYFLGWESIELHQDATKSDAFAEEMDKLAPWMAEESGAWYVTLKRHE